MHRRPNTTPIVAGYTDNDGFPSKQCQGDTAENQFRLYDDASGRCSTLGYGATRRFDCESSERNSVEDLASTRSSALPIGEERAELAFDGADRGPEELPEANHATRL